jgi:hypothetical protein
MTNDFDKFIGNYSYGRGGGDPQLQARIANLESALRDIRKTVYVALTLDNITPKTAEDIFATITAETGKP